MTEIFLFVRPWPGSNSDFLWRAFGSIAIGPKEESDTAHLQVQWASKRGAGRRWMNWARAGLAKLCGLVTLNGALHTKSW